MVSQTAHKKTPNVIPPADEKQGARRGRAESELLYYKFNSEPVLSPRALGVDSGSIHRNCPRAAIIGRIRRSHRSLRTMTFTTISLSELLSPDKILYSSHYPEARNKGECFIISLIFDESALKIGEDIFSSHQR